MAGGAKKKEKKISWKLLLQRSAVRVNTVTIASQVSFLLQQSAPQDFILCESPRMGMKLTLTYVFSSVLSK